MSLFLILTACSGGVSVKTSEAGAAISTTATTTSTTSTTTTVVAEQEWDLSRPFVGFSISPRAYDQEGLDDFFDGATELGSLVAWVGPWQDMGEGGLLVTTLSEDGGIVPVVVTGFPSEDGLRVLPDDPASFIDTLVEFVEDNPVPYLGVGVETNMFLWEESPEEFERYVALFAQVAEAIHDAAPETKVFPGFQLERLRGLKGGLFGDDPTDPEWELLERFPTADAIGFTTYPGLVFTDPSEMPDDYYSEILDHVDKPVVFTEVGWQAGGDLADWSGTPEKQSAYVEAFLPEMAGLADMVIWSFLWDQEAAPPAFDTMGLISVDDVRRPGWDSWSSAFGG